MAALRSTNNSKLAEQVCVTDTVKVSQLVLRTLSKHPSNSRETSYRRWLNYSNITKEPSVLDITVACECAVLFNVKGCPFISWGEGECWSKNVTGKSFILFFSRLFYFTVLLVVTLHDYLSIKLILGIQGKLLLGTGKKKSVRQGLYHKMGLAIKPLNVAIKLTSTSSIVS